MTSSLGRQGVLRLLKSSQLFAFRSSQTQQTNAVFRPFITTAKTFDSTLEHTLPIDSQFQRGAACADLPHEAKVKRLSYRSKQRGYLELDLIVGSWAEQQLPKMTTKELDEFAVVLDQENPDLFPWLTGQDEAPAHMNDNSVFQQLRAHMKKNINTHSDLQSRAAHGKSWVRGWGDSGEELKVGEHGNQ